MTHYIQTAFFVFAVFVAVSVHGQVTTPSAEQLAALEKAKTDSLTAINYQQLLNMLDITLPVLPDKATDPKRPKNTFQKDAIYLDKEGHRYSRTQWGDWINFDENLAKDYTLPDPLVLKNGKAVINAQIWWKQRRPEIVTDYETEIFGRVPKNTPKVTFDASNVDNTALDGTAIKKTITGRIDNSAYPDARPVINLVLYSPAKAKGPVPLMVIASSNTSGNNQIIKLLISGGWAVALFDTNSLQADNGAGLSQGIIGLVGHGKARNPEDWGTLRAWSWGLSRALDYLQTDKAINSKQIGIAGHSRWGKTVLLAGAMDARWAIVFASCSGSLGASLERRIFGETVGVVAGQSEYHWMAPNFVKYGGNWKTTLPVDAHDMMALIAPRPLFITGGTQDIWADPQGEFEACVAATPVYRLLGKTGITTNEIPAPDVSLINGELAFRNHEGGHTDMPDCPVFIEFAKKYFK
ncbi:MAG TPA: hypothetical protein VFC65_07155 [Prolixibacteraceae bacterium]|nr:hypothetical protein [Prolixibacteraceae bacterium]